MFRPDIPVRAVAAGLCLVALSAPAMAGNGVKARLDAVQRDLDRHMTRHADLAKKARRAEAEIHSLKVQAVDLARRMHQRSRAIDGLEDRLNSLENQENEKAARLRKRRKQLIATLGALQRIASLPTATLIAMPRPPDATIRSAILLRSVVPELRDEARQLRGELAGLANLRRQIKDKRSQLDDAVKALAKKRVTLASLTARKLNLLNSTQDAELKAAQEAAKLSEKAGSLRDLLERLSRPANIGALKGADFEPVPDSVKAPEHDARRSRSEAPLGALPVPGRIVTTFGEKLPNGMVSRGISIETRPSASVVAPKAGRVVFAGKFRGYGKIVILKLRGNKHALIAGLGKIDAEIGDQVLAGEPLGEMTPSTSEAPRLYFELRKRGEPINPLPRSAALKTR